METQQFMQFFSLSLKLVPNKFENVFNLVSNFLFVIINPVGNTLWLVDRSWQQTVWLWVLPYWGLGAQTQFPCSYICPLLSRKGTSEIIQADMFTLQRRKLSSTRYRLIIRVRKSGSLILRWWAFQTVPKPQRAHCGLEFCLNHVSVTFSG